MKPAKCRCGEEAVVYKSHDRPGEWWATCNSASYCNATTPDMPTREDAIRVWNAMQEAAGKEGK